MTDTAQLVNTKTENHAETHSEVNGQHHEHASVDVKVTTDGHSNVVVEHAERDAHKDAVKGHDNEVHAVDNTHTGDNHGHEQTLHEQEKNDAEKLQHEVDAAVHSAGEHTHADGTTHTETTTTEVHHHHDDTHTQESHLHQEGHSHVDEAVLNNNDKHEGHHHHEGEHTHHEAGHGQVVEHAKVEEAVAEAIRTTIEQQNNGIETPHSHEHGHDHHHHNGEHAHDHTHEHHHHKDGEHVDHDHKHEDAAPGHHHEANGEVEINIEKRNGVEVAAGATTDESIKGQTKLKNLEEIQGEQKSKQRKGGNADNKADTCNCAIF